MSSGPSLKKRNYLPLETKVAVIREAERLPRSNLRSLSLKYGCGKTQIANILKRKETILASYESDGLSNQARLSQFREVNEALHEWYKKVCAEGVSPTGAQIVDEAKGIAERLGKTGFKGTNGWLSKWKKRYNLQKSRRNTKERLRSFRGGVKVHTTDDSLPSTLSSIHEYSPSKIQISHSDLLRQYTRRNIFFLDQTSLLWKALPCPDFCDELEGISSGDIMRLAFLVNAVGHKETPVVVGKHESPKCLHGCDVSSLPVKYHHHRDGWLTVDILLQILNDFNIKLCREKRSVVVLLNQSFHPSLVEQCYSNIEISYLSESHRSLPLDWAIRMFKCQYRQFLLRKVIAKIHRHSLAEDVAGEVDILTAIHWVALAWERVDSIIVLKSISRAGIFDSEGAATSDDAEPFEDTDEYVNLSWLISIAMGGGEHCSAEEYTTQDSLIPTDFDTDECGDEDAPGSPDLVVDNESLESDGEQRDHSSGSCRGGPQTFLGAIQCLEKVGEFMSRNGMSSDVVRVTELVDQLSHQHIVSLTQTAMEITLNHEESSSNHDNSA